MEVVPFLGELIHAFNVIVQPRRLLRLSIIHTEIETLDSLCRTQVDEPISILVGVSKGHNDQLEIRSTSLFTQLFTPEVES